MPRAASLGPEARNATGMDPRMAEHPTTNPAMSRFSPAPENVRHDIIDKWPGHESPTTRSFASSVVTDPAELVKMH
jgi:hypothetical protein